jgi:hypothetical protein
MNERPGFTGTEAPERWIKEPPRGEEKKQQQNGQDTDAAVGLECMRLEAVGASKIPPRTWAYGKFLLFGSAAVIGAVDGAGKGAVAVVKALAMITGKPLLGERVWRTGPVAIISYEDDEDEWHRRIAAACIHFDIDYDTVMQSIYFIRRRGGRVVFAQRHLTGDTLFPDGEAIIRHLRRIGAVLLIIDPFNNAHAMDDGNNNVAIARVADEISRIAREAAIAALVLHHLRKGSNGSLDDLMGATSLRANFRACRILARMTPDEASALNLSPNEAWRHLRIAGTKANYAPPPDKATWFRLESVSLGNPADIYTEGDEVGVATPWQPPSAFEGIHLATLSRIFDRLRGEPEPGWFYSTRPRAKFPAKSVIVEEAGKSPEQAATVLKAWEENGVFTTCGYKTPNRDDGSRIVLNEAKVAEIVAYGPAFDD